MITIKNKYNYDCDVLIIGGGPAGSGLAWHLATKGVKVIIIEAEKFPRDKICGDAVSSVALNELHKLGITGLEGFAKASVINDVAIYIEQEKVTIDLERSEELPFQGRIIPRLELDNWIATAAKKAGAVYLEEHRLVDYYVNAHSVQAQVKQAGVTKTIVSKLIVGADGSNSTVARIIKGVKPSEDYQLLGLRAYYEGVNGPGDRCDIFFSGDNFPGLFWFFPTGPNTANIGSAMIKTTLPQNPKHVRAILDNQIKNNKYIAERIGDGKIKGKVHGWPLTFQEPETRVVSSRLLLVGDAAGLINPLSGDGIQYALLSASWASECIIECVDNDNFSHTALSVYEKKLKKEMAYDMALSQLLVQVTRNRSFTPLWIEVLKILFERAKNDKQYAAVIGGIFDGSLPSYKALSSTFLVKSVAQIGKHLNETVIKNISDPPKLTSMGFSLMKTVLQVADDVINNPQEQKKWLLTTVRKAGTVAGHTIKDVRLNRKRPVTNKGL